MKPIKKEGKKWKECKLTIRKVALISLGVVIGVAWTVSYFQWEKIAEPYTVKYLNTGVVVKTEAHVRESVEESNEVLQEGDEILSLSTDKIVSLIYRMESSGGKNDRCQRLGLGYNSYGFGVYNGNYPCYETQEEVTNLVTEWVNQHRAEGMTWGQLACHYNTGTPSDTCEYYDKMLKL